MPNIPQDAPQSSRAPLATLTLVVGGLAVGLLLLGREVAPSSQDPSDSPQLRLLAEAVRAYQLDHGFFPGSREDFGYPLNDEALREKLLLHTDATGQTHDVATRRFRYGPYLESFPADPQHGDQAMRWVLGEEDLSEERLHALADEAGGWIYAPEAGVIQANLAEPAIP